MSLEYSITLEKDLQVTSLFIVDFERMLTKSKGHCAINTDGIV